MKRLFHFFGGIYFAIFLLTAVVLFVMIGTFLESHTESHQYASRFTYGNPFFALLLWGFFINILFAALRRWPFKIKHIPFLITHFGLLMILGGALIKNYFGIQGMMRILEGSGSHEIFLPDTYSVYLESKDSGQKKTYPLQTNHPNINIALKEFIPHAQEKLETWIHGPQATILGLKPFQAENGDHLKVLPVSSRAILSLETVWDLMALRTEEISKTAKKAYLQGMKITLRDPFSDALLYENLLEEALHHPIQWPDGLAIVNLEFEPNPLLRLELFFKNDSQEIEIPLSGKESLIKKNKDMPHLGTPVLVDLQRSPTIAIIQDPENTSLFAFDPWGRVYHQPFSSLNSLVVYDGGFGGYAVQAEIPFANLQADRKALETHQLNQIEKKLQECLDSSESLLPPLQLLKEASTVANVDFIQCCLEMLDKAKKSPHWIVRDDVVLSENLKKAIDSISWDEGTKKACQWICALSDDLEDQIKDGRDFIAILKQRGWPFVDKLEAARELSGSCKPEEFELLMMTLARQMMSVGPVLPEMQQDPYTHLNLLSAYLRTYGIHVNCISLDPFPYRNFVLESPIIPRYRSLPPLLKLEDNQPKITLQLNHQGQKECISLLYDRSGAALKWPALKGKYLLRFQPDVKEIPYHVRLHQARQINYVGTAQPYSFESDLTIMDRRTGQAVEKTISMNNVYETWEGYRFYMANIATTETDVKRIQIAVNHDPAKYWLTYPGAILATLGICLLFWMRKKIL